MAVPVCGSTHSIFGLFVILLVRIDWTGTQGMLAALFSSPNTVQMVNCSHQSVAQKKSTRSWGVGGDSFGGSGGVGVGSGAGGGGCIGDDGGGSCGGCCSRGGDGAQVVAVAVMVVDVVVVIVEVGCRVVEFGVRWQRRRWLRCGSHDDDTDDEDEDDFDNEHT